ncbi:MAG: PEP/pyruvate-binding domain-containing protein [Candidatus Orphnella occulta]|nr:PEP/pyruvate-binding domain-containing protein [Candidatus Orphnella occulta]
MLRNINKFLSYLIVITFLSTSTNLSYLSQQEFQSQTDTLRSQAAILGLDIGAMKSQLTAPEQETAKASSAGADSDAVSDIIVQSFMENNTVVFIDKALATVELKDLPTAYKEFSDKYKGVLLQEIGRKGIVALFQKLEEDANDLFKEGKEKEATNLYKSVIFFAKIADALIVHDSEFDWIGNISLLGGKIDNSLMLSKGKLEVPPFFGITSMFQKYVWLYNDLLPKMREIGFTVDPQNNTATSSAQARFEQLIKDTHIPQDLQSMLNVEVRKIADREGYALSKDEADKLETEAIEIIFRSSQGLEDRPGIPSAGIGSSVPTMGTDGMLDVFKDVAASAYLRRALEYRDKIAISTWLLSRMNLDELKHIVNKLKGLSEVTPKVEVGGIFYNTSTIIEDIEANLAEDLRSRKEFVNVSTLRVLTLLELLQEQSAKDVVVDKALAEIRDVRIDCLDAARIGGGIQTQTMRSSEYSIVGFALNKATGWTGDANDMVVIDYDISYGRGELIVQGSIISDHYKILMNLKTGKAIILSKECGSKLATLKRVKAGEEIKVWADSKHETTETIIAEEGQEYLAVTPVEDRQRFVVSDEKAMEIAHKILEANTVHNAGRTQVVPVDMEACYYHDTKGKLQYSIVQKRDSAIKSGFDFEDPDFVIHAGKEPIAGLADAAQEQGHMKAKGFETQNAASGVTVWVEEPSANRVKKAVENIWAGAGEDALNEFLPQAHPDLYTPNDKLAIIEKILRDKVVVDTGIQDDFDVEGFDFDKARILERIISKDSTSEETIKEIESAYSDKLEKEAVVSIAVGVMKLFRSTDNLEDRMRILSSIIRVNIFSSPKGDLKKAFVEEHAGVLERDVLNRQFDKIKAMIKDGINVVMVTPETNPNFNDIMKFVDENGGATITRQGGRSAHAIIISIQFGYCVVGGAEFNDADLLERIKDGEQVLLTVDGNKGQVYDIEIPITSFFSSFQPRRWGNYGGDIGLITNAPNEVEKASKNHHWQIPVDHEMYPYMEGKKSVGYYSVSLDRIEEILIELGLDFRGAYAYDRMFAIRAGELDEPTLSRRQRSDIAKLRSRRDLVTKVGKKINDKGFILAVEYLRHELASHFKQMLATTKPGQVVQVRLRDLKKREILKTQDTAELFYNDEEASMIGDRGTGLEVHDENIEAIDLQVLALEDARIAAEELGGLGDLGFMFVFIRRVLDDPELGIESDLKKGLNRLLKLRREGKIQRIPKQVGVMFELVINALLAEELAEILADFREQVKEEFNEDISTYFSNGTNDLTQSVKGSRDEGRYVNMDILMPNGDITKGIRVFYEGDPAVGDTIAHGAFVAKKYGHKRGSCGEYFNNLLNAGDPESIDSARDGFGRLDSAGTSIKVFPKAVKLLADSQLAKQHIPTNIAVKAEVLAEGKSLHEKGAAHRTAVFIRSEDDFITERVIYRDGGKNRDIRYAPKAVEGDVLILSTDIAPDNKKLLETLDSQASGVVLAGKNGTYLKELQALLVERSIPTIIIKKDIFTKLIDFKQYVFDFERGAIYTENNISFDIEFMENKTAYAHIDYDAKPKEASVETVDMDNIYKMIGIHPLALTLYALHTGEIENSTVETIDGGQIVRKLDKIISQQRIPLAKNKFPAMYSDVKELLDVYNVDSVRALISKATKQAVEMHRKVLPEGTTLAFGTSQQDAWAFEELKWGKRETELELNVFNVPIDLRGLAKTISPGYGDIFEMFLEVVKEEGLDIQFNYVQDLNILDTAIEFLNQKGLVPGEDGFNLGMSASTSHNFIVAYRYFSKRDISFVKFDDALLLMNFALANLDYHTDVRRWDGSFEPLININERSYQEALKRAKAMLRTAMVNHNVAEVTTLKSSSSGNSALNEVTKLIVQSYLNKLYSERWYNGFRDITKALKTRFVISGGEFLENEIPAMLETFSSKIKQDFGDDTVISISAYANGSQTNLSVSILIKPKLTSAAQLAIQAQLEGLLLSIKDSEETGSKEQLRTGFTLSGNDFLSDEFQTMLTDFKSQVRNSFGKNVFLVASDVVGGKKGLLNVAVLIEDAGTMLKSKSSSGGTSEFDEVKELSYIESELDRLYQALRAHTIEGTIAILNTRLDLFAHDNNLHFEVYNKLEAFEDKIKDEFGEEVVTTVQYDEGEQEGSVSLSVSIQFNNEAVAPKSSSSGDSKLSPVELSLERQLAEQLALRRAGTITSINKKIEVNLSLPTDNDLLSRLLAKQKDFVDTVKQEFGEIVVTEYVIVKDGINMSIGGSGNRKDQESVTDTWKTSSGGTIHVTPAEKVTELLRNIKSNVNVKERFDVALNKLDGLGAAAANEVKDILESVHKELYTRLDSDIMGILSVHNSNISSDDEDALRDMVSIQYQAEQYLSNIDTIMYAADGKLSEDIAPRVMILPATTAVSNQALLAKEEIQAIEENLGVITVISNNPIQSIKDILEGGKLVNRDGHKVEVLGNDIAVVLTEGQVGMADDVNIVLGTSNTLVMSNISISQYVPFSQLAMLAKVQLILNKIGVTSSEAGPYRSAFFAIWKGVTGNPFIGNIEQFITNPAAYVISILVAPVSTLSAIEIKILHDRAARIWA